MRKSDPLRRRAEQLLGKVRRNIGGAWASIERIKADLAAWESRHILGYFVKTKARYEIGTDRYEIGRLPDGEIICVIFRPDPENPDQTVHCLLREHEIFEALDTALARAERATHQPKYTTVL